MHEASTHGKSARNYPGTLAGITQDAADSIVRQEFLEASADAGILCAQFSVSRQSTTCSGGLGAGASSGGIRAWDWEHHATNPQADAPRCSAGGHRVEW